MAYEMKRMHSEVKVNYMSNTGDLNMNKIMVVFVFAVFAYLFSGCAQVHYKVQEEAVPVEALEKYKQDKAEVPARIQVVNFVVNSVDADYSDDDKNIFRRHNNIAIPNMLQRSLGERKVFSEVVRTESPNPVSTDYVISGTYDFIRKAEKGFTSHSISIKGAMHVRVVRAKDNVPIMDKDYVEERSDTAKKQVAVSVTYLQKAYIESITAEIKKTIAQDLDALRTIIPASSR
jgi:hypothetical protein